MGYDQPERSGSSGAVVAVILAVLLILVVGGLFVVGVGAFLWVGTTRVATERALVAEREARQMAEEVRALAETKIAEAAAEKRQAEALALAQRETVDAAAPDSQPDLTVNVSEDGSLSISGEQIDLDGLRERLAKLKEETGRPISVSLSVHPDCPARNLQPVLTACYELGNATIRVAAAEESEPSGGTEVPE